MVVLALGIVYVVWGSTYLAIRVVVEDMPALAAASWRYLAAGVLLALVLVVRGGPARLRISGRAAVSCALIGLLLPALGNGLVSVGESMGAPSGITALLIAAVPLWVIVFRAATGDRPPARTATGVLMGFAGLILLVAATGLGGHVDLAASLVITVAAVFWSLGSWATPKLELPPDAFVATAYEMAFGGVWLLVLATLRGEDVVPGAAPASSWFALAYLITFGSVVAFTAYVWVLTVAPVSLVATYAYVNPVVAVFLGWLILSEPITAPIVAGGSIVVAAVALVVSSERRPRRRLQPAGATDAA